MLLQHIASFSCSYKSKKLSLYFLQIICLNFHIELCRSLFILYTRKYLHYDRAKVILQNSRVRRCPPFTTRYKLNKVFSVVYAEIEDLFCCSATYIDIDIRN